MSAKVDEAAVHAIGKRLFGAFCAGNKADDGWVECVLDELPERATVADLEFVVRAFVRDAKERPRERPPGAGEFLGRVERVLAERERKQKRKAPPESIPVNQRTFAEVMAEVAPGLQRGAEVLAAAYRCANRVGEHPNEPYACGWAAGGVTHREHHAALARGDDGEGP